MVHLSKLNGRGTAADAVVRKRAAIATMRDAIHAWILQGSTGQVYGNYNTNNTTNKNQSRACRAVVALSLEEKTAWIDAYFDCIRNKLTSKQCAEYRIDFERDLWKLAQEVHHRTYLPSKAFCFIVTRPRIREIFAASFRDRIVQHWITIGLEPLLERNFLMRGNISYNCRKNYGSLKAVLKAEELIKQVTDNYIKQAWVGKIDVASFFMGIDKEILLEQLIPFIRENYTGDDIDTLIWLTEVTIRHQPQKLCERRTPRRMWDHLPADKSLYNMPARKGLPIGNITSQLIANFYLSDFDSMMVEECGYVGAGCVRFVDDIFIVARDKQFIMDMRNKAAQYLKKYKNLTLHKNKFYLQPASHGVKFVGTVIKPGRKYTGNRTMGNMAIRVHQTNLLCKDIIENGITLPKLKSLHHMVNCLNSYMGFCVHTQSYNYRRKLFGNAPFFWKCCYIHKRFAVVQVRKKFNYNIHLVKTNQLQYETERRNDFRAGNRAARNGTEHLHGKCGRRRNARGRSQDPQR